MNHLIHLHADGLEVMIVGGFWLSDRAWAAIEPLLPSNQPGARRVDDRRVISGIVHVLRVGCRWQDCPSDYGPATTVYGLVAVWCRSFDSVMCIKGDELWAQSGRMNFARMRCGSH